MKNTRVILISLVMILDINELKKIELDYVTAKTNELAECPDEECEEYDNNWLEVIDLLERNNKGDTECVVKRITKNGVVYDRNI